MSQRPGSGHAGEAANARAAHDAVQNRLGLIVGRMGRGHEAGAQPTGGLLQEAISSRSGRSFNAVAGSAPPCDPPRHGQLRTSRPGRGRAIRQTLRRRPRRHATDDSDVRHRCGRTPLVFNAVIARNRATLSPPPEIATITVTSAHWFGGHASGKSRFQAMWHGSRKSLLFEQPHAAAVFIGEDDPAAIVADARGCVLGQQQRRRPCRRNPTAAGTGPMAEMPTVDSAMQPIITFRPNCCARAIIRRAGVMPPHLTSLMLMPWKRPTHTFRRPTRRGSFHRR